MSKVANIKAMEASSPCDANFPNNNRGPEIQWVVLATGDSDFGPVFRKLRELGKGVVGVGPSSVLSTSVSSSCHDFLFTDNTAANNGGGGRDKKKGRGKGGGYCGEHQNQHYCVNSPARGAVVSTRAATPPQCFLSSRGCFRIKHQGTTINPTSLASPKLADVNIAEESDASTHTPTKSPLLLGAPSTSPRPEVGAETPSPTRALLSPARLGPPRAPAVSGGPRLLHAGMQAGVLGHEQPAVELKPAEPLPMLAPWQLLLPEMVTDKVAPAAAAATESIRVPPAPPARPTGASRSSITFPPKYFTGDSCRRNISGGGGADGGAGSGNNSEHRAAAGGGALASPRALVGSGRPEVREGGLGALSVIRPSQKLYRHLLALDSAGTRADAVASGGAAGVATNDWGNDLSEVTLARGLVALAAACGGQDSKHCQMVAALAAGAAASSHSSSAQYQGNHGGSSPDFGGGGGGGNSGGDGVGDWATAATDAAAGFPREEAYRVAGLLQRCGFLTWMGKEQQWLVTVPADVEVLRRRRDDVMMEELRSRCREASVPFEPGLAASLRWTNRSG